MKTQTIESTWRAGRKRIEKERLFAAWYVLTHIYNRDELNDELIRKGALSCELWRDSRIYAAEYFFNTILGDEERNIEHIRDRYWENSKSVLHLMMPIVNKLKEVKNAKKFYFSLLVNSFWINNALLEAEVWRQILPNFFPSLSESETIKVNHA